MSGEYLLRFLLGGFMVSAFALISDVLKPKSFAGLFAAAPSIAIGTLALAMSKHGSTYVSVEGRSMTIAAFSLAAYSQAVAWLLMRRKWQTWIAAAASLLLWFALTAVGWLLMEILS